jgi:hypothetical protein
MIAPGSRGMVLALLVLLIVGAGTYANIQYARTIPGGYHFLPGWLAARTWVAEGGSPYSSGVRNEAETLMHGRPADPRAGEELGVFAYPLPALIFYLPLATLDYETARGIWMAVLEAGLIGFVLLGQHRAWRGSSVWGTALGMGFALATVHSLQALLVGQFAILEAVLVAAAIRAVALEDDVPAGILLGLSLGKPQISFLLLPFVLLWASWMQRWRIVIACASTIAILYAGSLAVLPGWPMQWAQQIAGLAAEVPPRTALSAAILGGRAVDTWTVVLLTTALLIYMLWEWTQVRGQGGRWFQWTAWLTVAVTGLVGPRWTSTDNVMLIPCWIWLFGGWQARWKRPGAVLSAAAALALILVPWAVYFRSDPAAPEAPGLLLLFPLAALLGLWWYRWWAIRTDVLPLEREVE